MDWIDFVVPLLALLVGYRVGVGIERARGMLERASALNPPEEEGVVRPP